jgi:hypothetical protein
MAPRPYSQGARSRTDSTPSRPAGMPSLATMATPMAFHCEYARKHTHTCHVVLFAWPTLCRTAIRTVSHGLLHGPESCVRFRHQGACLHPHRSHTVIAFENKSLCTSWQCSLPTQVCSAHYPAVLIHDHRMIRIYLYMQGRD